jgi:hypothetical protein
MSRHAVVFAGLWWIALLGWWILLAGTNAGLEEIAAACAATLGTGFALALRKQRLLRIRFEAAWLAKAPGATWKIVQELAVVTWSLALHIARVRTVASAYRAIPFPAGREDAVSAGRRAVAALTDSLSPNTVPVDVDLERNVALRHELDPRHAGDTMP